MKPSERIRKHAEESKASYNYACRLTDAILEFLDEHAHVFTAAPVEGREAVIPEGAEEFTNKSIVWESVSGSHEIARDGWYFYRDESDPENVGCRWCEAGHTIEGQSHVAGPIPEPREQPEPKERADGDACAKDIVLEALECLEGDEEWCEESNMYEQTGRGELGTEAINALKAERARHAEEVARLKARVDELERKWYVAAPSHCPITGREFFMSLESEAGETVATYGGPFDSYTIPHVEDGEVDDEKALRCERYDHDAGRWVDGGHPLGLVIVDDEKIPNLIDRAEKAEAEAAELREMLSAEVASGDEHFRARNKLEAELAALQSDYDALAGDNMPGFGVDPRDSTALDKLRSAIDQHGVWPDEETEGEGDYEECVRHMGRLARERACLFSETSKIDVRRADANQLLSRLGIQNPSRFLLHNCRFTVEALYPIGEAAEVVKVEDSSQLSVRRALEADID